MEVKKIGENTYAIRLVIDEEIMSSLTSFTKEQKIPFATLQGIGAIKVIEIGFYELPKKKFEKKFFKEDHELLTAIGNITWLENGEPFVHLHVTLGGADYKVVGGHLFSAKIAVTGEFILNSYSSKIFRTPNSQVGLNLWSLCH